MAGVARGDMMLAAAAGITGSRGPGRSFRPTSTTRLIDRTPSCCVPSPAMTNRREKRSDPLKKKRRQMPRQIGAIALSGMAKIHLCEWGSSQRPNTTSTPDRIDSSLARLILPTASPRTVLSKARICETLG